MPNISLRGVDAPTLARIKATAKRRKVSVNRLIVDTLHTQFSAQDKGFDDLDDLAGQWTRAQALEFESNVAPFSEIESGMWVAEPLAAYEVTVKRKKQPTAKAAKR